MKILSPTLAKFDLTRSDRMPIGIHSGPLIVGDINTPKGAIAVPPARWMALLRRRA